VCFNEEILPDVYSDTIWESQIPEEFLHLTRPDTSRWEGVPGHSFFPHLARAEVATEGDRGLNSWRLGTPFPDKAVLHLAMEAVEERKLGQRREVDFLALSFSQTDAMGHGYGPRSREQLDNLIRLDGLLGQLMEFLDEKVGEGNWVMALTSDHGVSDIPELLDEPVTRLAVDDVREVLQTAQNVLTDRGTNGGLPRRLVEALEPLPSFRRVFTFDELEVDQPADSFARFYANSHVPGRLVNQLARFGVYIQWQPHSLVAPSWLTRRAGTDHRSAYYFDRWVPLIFFGAGVEAGWSDGVAATVDVAPTLAALVGIPAPDDLDGEVLIPRMP
jgi:predicted AlkP superfamily pyrophosphatase or phosphodiesterase